MYFKGKGKNWSSGKGTSAPPRSFVNSYTTEYFGLDMSTKSSKECHSTSLASTQGDFEGMVDCGATASAGPELAVQGLIKAVVAQDHSAVIKVDQSARPYFRYGNGKWGRALYQVNISSAVSGETRNFKVYALSNPPELHAPGFLGMDHLGQHGASMMIDFTTGLALNTLEDDPRPYPLRQNHKGHYVLDIREYLTKGQHNPQGHAHVLIKESPGGMMGESHVLEFHPLHLQLDSAEHDVATVDCAIDPRRILMMDRLRRASAQMRVAPQPREPNSYTSRTSQNGHVPTTDVTPECGGRGTDLRPDQEVHSQEEDTTGLRPVKECGTRLSRSDTPRANGHATDAINPRCRAIRTANGLNARSATTAFSTPLGRPVRGVTLRA